MSKLKDYERCLYFTGSRAYDNGVTKQTDYDYFGLVTEVEQVKHLLEQDGFTITEGEYFNKSYYAQRDEVLINLITIRRCNLSMWALLTFITKILFDNDILRGNSKRFYVTMFEVLLVVLKPMSYVISDTIFDKLIKFTDMYPEIIDLHDVVNAKNPNKDTSPF
jgi:hypothetical protein